MAGGQRDSGGVCDGGTNSVAASTRSRRALGDVSNQDSKESSDNATKRSEGQSLRRSRRISNGAAARTESNPAEVTDDAVPRRQPLRSAAAQAREMPATHPFGEPAPKARAARKRGASKATSTNEEDDSKPPARDTKPKAKRPRATQGEGTAPRKRNRQPSNNSRSEKAANDDPVSVDGPLVWCHNPCQDVLPHTDHRLQRIPFSAREFTPGISCYDAKDTDNILQVPSYATDIFQRLHHAEESSYPRPYMARQPELNGMMRAILIDWLVEVHMKFRLLPETLYLCVNIIDRYLSLEQVYRNRLQLVGVTSLLIACKYEEMYPPEVKDCVYITDRAYTRQDVLDMEANIVKVLRFSLTVPTGHPFLQRFLYITESSALVRNLANYYMERMLQEHSALEFKPSLLAAAAVCLANSNPDRLDCEGFSEEDHREKIPAILIDYAGFHEDDIRKAAAHIEAKVGEENPVGRSRSLVAVKRKYESSRYSQVSTNFIPPKVCHLDSP